MIVKTWFNLDNFNSGHIPFNPPDNKDHYNGKAGQIPSDRL
jgi:hypothetical protein